MSGTHLQPAEITGAVAALSHIDPQDEIYDPFPWHDLRHALAETSDVVIGRISDEIGPRRVQLFPWPKETGGHRLFSVVDPFDRIGYHALGGRVAAPVAAHLGDEVTSFELQTGGPGYRWSLTSGKRLHRARVDTAKARLGVPPDKAMVTADVKNHFGSTTTAAITSALGPMWVNEHAYEPPIAWLECYQGTHEGPGVPLGHDASRLLAHAALHPVDGLLRGAGIRFVRWVDDFWLFVEPGSVADREALTVLGDALAEAGYQFNEAKTNTYDPFDALDVIESSAIASAIERERSGGAKAAVQELFEFAAENPQQRASELRWSLRHLASQQNTAPVTALLTQPELVDVAHASAVHYLQQLAANKKTVNSVDIDALVELACDPTTARDHPSRSLAALKVLASVKLAKADSNRLLEFARGPAGRQSTLRTWAVRAAQHSRPISGRNAVEGVLTSVGVDVKRAFALTLQDRKDHSDLKKWTDRMLLDEPDLRPTVTWLRDGAPVP